MLKRALPPPLGLALCLTLGLSAAPILAETSLAVGATSVAAEGMVYGSTTAAIAKPKRRNVPPPPVPVCDEVVWTCDGGIETPGGPGQPTEPGSGGGKPQPCVSKGAEVPCTSRWGFWSDPLQCYLRPHAAPSKPPPPGKTGRWYLCHQLDADPAAGGAEYEVWLDEPPSVDPGQLALDILAHLQLEKIRIGITPAEGKTGLLGLPTYLWVDNPGARTLGPISDSDTQGNVTVTLTAKVDHVTWNLGDGTTITCTGAGTPYQDSFGAAPSPTCGHMYRRPSTSLPGGSYPVSATAVWQVDWTGGGEAGSIPFEITSTGSVRISEAQALN